MLLEVPVADIVIGERHRQDMGDLETLAESMRELGLLQPIGITEHRQLVFGERRVKAAQMLGWACILARVVDISSIVAGEYAENEIRKDFTPSERVAIVEAMRTLHRGGDRVSEQFRHGGIAAIATDRAVRRAGFTSQDQFERARRVVTDGAPELTAAMDSGKASITAAATLASQPPDFQCEITEQSPSEIRRAVGEVRRARQMVKTAPPEVNQAVAAREVSAEVWQGVPATARPQATHVPPPRPAPAEDLAHAEF
jgi:ParB-like chromosome segregation protein Spo0J